MRALEIYAERFGLANGRMPATFEIITLTAWAPHESQQKPLQPGTEATIPLAQALGTAGAAGRRTRGAPDKPSNAKALLVHGGGGFFCGIAPAAGEPPPPSADMPAEGANGDQRRDQAILDGGGAAVVARETARNVASASASSTPSPSPRGPHSSSRSRRTAFNGSSAGGIA